MNIFILLVVLSVFISSVSQIFLKKSSMKEHRAFIFEYLNVKVAVGYFLFSAAVFFNVFALKNGVQIKEIPIIESLGYLFVPLLSFLFLKENISRKKAVGIGVIIAGIIVFYLK